MSRTTAEIFIFAVNACGAGILLFVAGVLQPIMDELPGPEFRQFVGRLERQALRDPAALTIATLPIPAAGLYVAFFGISQRWFIAGLILWLAGSAVTKVINLPVYAWARARPGPGEMAAARQRRLRIGNRLRAWLTLASVLLMACQFGWKETGWVSGAMLLLAVPLTALGRRAALR